jgi:penicillin-binding protein 2
MARATIKDHFRESALFNARLLVALLSIFLLLILLIMRLSELQLLDHEHYTTLSRGNRVKLEPLPPTRGLIFDRNGVTLAQNLPVHSLEIIPEQVDDMDQLLTRLGKIISIQESDLERFNRQQRQYHRFDSIPIRSHLNEEEIARFAVTSHHFPKVRLQAKLLRNYPLAEDSSHLLGYVGRINQKELAQLDAAIYAGTNHIGKTGVEKYYERALLGSVGHRRVEVNVIGRPIRTIESEPPTPGKDLFLSIDAELQRLAMEQLGEHNGAIVAIDPRSGSILLLASKPGFDPNLFVEGISAKEYKALQNSSEKPLFNRALRGRYPPGSTAKPFIGLAGLEYGLTTFNKTTMCRGFFQLPGHDHKYRDWKKDGHGIMRLNDAIIQSCDVYFYDLALQLGIDRIHSFLSRFGFGKTPGVDISGAISGLLPSQQWKRTVKRSSWYAGETLIVGIGQGYFLTTPLELARATATLASRGHYFPPRVLQAIREPSATTPTNTWSPQATLLTDIEEKNLEYTIEAMADVVEGAKGTARRIYTKHYRIAGKTGTAQVFTIKQDEEYDEEKVEKKKRDHALFIAFAPVEEPRIAVVVVVENGGHGGSVAAPMARSIMDSYLLRGNR